MTYGWFFVIQQIENILNVLYLNYKFYFKVHIFID